MKIEKTVVLITFVAFLFGCSLTKHVPKNESLLNKVYVKNNTTNITKGNLQSYILQKPNTYMLGFMRVKLALYNISGNDTAKKVNRFFRRIGEPPVIFDDASMKSTEASLMQTIRNKGYLNAVVTSDFSTRRQKTDVNYFIESGELYKIRYFQIDIDNDSVLNILNRFYTVNSLEGKIFDVDLLNQTRDDITKNLRRRGYYNVKKEMFSYLADTIGLPHQVDLKLTLQPQYTADTIASKIFQKKTIGSVTIYCISTEDSLSYLDTVHYQNYTIIYNTKKHIFKPKFLASKVFLQPNQLYNERLVDRAISNFSGLSAFRYVNVNFTERDSNSIDCRVYLSPADKYDYSVSVEATTNSGSSIGAGINLGFKDKNFLHGAEVFKLGAHASYIAYLDTNLAQSFTIGGAASLTFPKLMVPFLKEDARLRYGASTSVSLNYDYQSHSLFRRSIANAAFGYKWQRRASNYSFDLANLSYVKMYSLNPAFIQQYPYLIHSYEDHLNLKMVFTYSTTNHRNTLANQNYYSFRSSVSAGGNVFGAISLIAGQKKNANGQYQVLGTPYSQFAKGDLDYSHNIFMDKTTRLVLHTYFGIGVPYGNANILPFEERFFCGGANSMRGWTTSTLGPGKFSTSNKTSSLLLQNGDIKLELNAEVRFKLFWVLEGAVFVDAGNVWTIKKYDEQKGGEFSFKNAKFIKEIAIDWGVGLRFDFSYFLIRFDLGIKLRDPSINQWILGSIKNYNALGWQFAIGYPF